MEPRYDVFLSHSFADSAAVEKIAHRLRDEAQIRPFFDRWHLVPGESWLDAIEEAVNQTETILVFVGPDRASDGLTREVQLVERMGVEGKGKRIVPVLLPGADPKNVPDFLRSRTWVDLNDEDAFVRLLAGIEGRAPEPPRSANVNSARVAARLSRLGFLINVIVIAIIAALLLYSLAGSLR